MLGEPSDVREEFEGAQAFVDAGYAEWIDEPVPVSHEVPVETTDSAPAVEVAVARPPVRRGRPPRSRSNPPSEA
jgi:hypothetical protein